MSNTLWYLTVPLAVVLFALVYWLTRLVRPPTLNDQRAILSVMPLYEPVRGLEIRRKICEKYHRSEEDVPARLVFSVLGYLEDIGMVEGKWAKPDEKHRSRSREYKRVARIVSSDTLPLELRPS